MKPEFTSFSRHRIVAYAADRQEIAKLLRAGFLRGPWSTRKRGYAIVRPMRKAGKPRKLSAKQVEQVRRVRMRYVAARSAWKRLPYDLNVNNKTIYDAVNRARSA